MPPANNNSRGAAMLVQSETQLDLQGLYDDLVRLPVIAENFGIPVQNLPWSIDGRTGAAGLTDAPVCVCNLCAHELRVEFEQSRCGNPFELDVFKLY